MIYDPTKHHRRSIRLKGFDYSSEGEYFVTICVQDRRCTLGEIRDSKMHLSPIGKIALRCWLEIPKHFPNVSLDAYVIMPDHMHGILVIDAPVGVRHVEPRHNSYQHIIPQSISSIILQYKSSVTRLSRRGNHSDFRWQRNYYEHIIRSEDDLNRIRDYIGNNIIQWQYDHENLQQFRSGGSGSRPDEAS